MARTGVRLSWCVTRVARVACARASLARGRRAARGSRQNCGVTKLPAAAHHPLVPLPPLTELLERAHVVALPLATRFRGVVTREAIVFERESGWLEWSPFVEYGDDEAATWLEAAVGEWRGGGERRDGGADANGRPTHAGAGAGASAGANTDAAARALVRVNATVPAVEAARVADVLARFDGCRTAKVKVAERGQALADDLARVAAVRAEMGPDARLRVDANAGWSVGEAVEALVALDETAGGLEYAEQPVPGIEGLARVRALLRERGVALRIAADESVRKASDPLAVARAQAADVIVIKAQPLGGVQRAAAVVRAAGLPATVSSALDTSVGIAMGARLAAAVAADSERFGAPVGGFDAGLGTASLFTDDVCDPPLRPRDGRVPASAPLPSPDAVRRLAAAADRDAWWRERLTRCHAVLEARLAAAPR